MTLDKKDFIAIEFTGRVKNGEIFDSNIKEDLLQKGVPPEAKNANLKTEPKPFVFCLGEGMFLKAIDDFLIGKDIGKYEIELQPEKAFGNRNSKLIQMIPLKIFREQKINPIPGIIFNFDGRIAKILTVSGGRVMVDFNNPIAGKIVTYQIKILRKIENINEKIKSLNEFLFKKDFKFNIIDKKLFIEVEKPMTKFVEMFKDKFKDIFGLDLEVKEIMEEKSKEYKPKPLKKSQ